MLKGATVSGRPKTMQEAKESMLTKLAARNHPMNSLPADEGVDWIQGVPGLDGESWGSYWESLGATVRRQAEAAEQSGDKNLASRLYQKASRSEEHTSELQSRENLVCRLLLEKKKK